MMRVLGEAALGEWLFPEEAAGFRRRLDKRRQAVASAPPGAAVLATGEDRLDFFAMAAAALLEERDLVLGSADWGRREREAVLATAGPCLLPDGRMTGGDPSGKAGARAPRVLIPTGGSSGGPRLAIHTWETLAASADAFLRFAGERELTHFSVLPPWHVSGFMPVVRAWRGGGRVRFGNPGDLSGDLAAGTVVSLVPTQLVRLAERDAWHSLRRARMVLLGGAGAPPRLLDGAARLKLPLVPCYGMTETAALACALPVEAFLAGGRGVGRPLDHAAVSIRDDDGADVPPGTDGRVWLCAMSLFHGYAGDGGPPPARGGWWATGDRGRLDREGWLTLLGRMDDVIVTGGEKVSASALEARLVESGLVRDAVVAGVPDEQWGERVVCACEPMEGVGERELVSWVRENLSRHCVPKQWIFTARVPRNAAGKPDRATLRAMVVEVPF